MLAHILFWSARSNLSSAVCRCLDVYDNCGFLLQENLFVLLHAPAFAARTPANTRINFIRVQAGLLGLFSRLSAAGNKLNEWVAGFVCGGCSRAAAMPGCVMRGMLIGAPDLSVVLMQAAG